MIGKTFRNSDGLITHYYDSDGALQFTEAYIADPALRKALEMPIIRISKAIYHGDKSATFSRKPVATSQELARASAITETLTAIYQACIVESLSDKTQFESEQEKIQRTLLKSFENLWRGLSYQKDAAGRRNRAAFLEAWENHLQGRQQQ